MTRPGIEPRSPGPKRKLLGHPRQFYFSCNNFIQSSLYLFYSPFSFSYLCYNFSSTKRVTIKSSFIFPFPISFKWPSRLGLQNTQTSSLQRGKTLSTSVLVWHLTIWWWGSSNAGALENVEYPFIASASRSTLTWSGSTWQGPIYGSNKSVWHLNCTYAKLNYLENKCLYM